MVEVSLRWQLINGLAPPAHARMTSNDVAMQQNLKTCSMEQDGLYLLRGRGPMPFLMNAGWCVAHTIVPSGQGLPW